jgi:hypothetical protein
VAAGALVAGAVATGLAGALAGAGAPVAAGAVATLEPWLKIFDIRVLKRPIDIFLVVCVELFS